MSAASKREKGATAHYFDISSADHPWQPRGPNGDARSEIAPWSETAYWFFDIKETCMPNAQAPRHLKKTPEMKYVTDIADQTMNLFGSIAGIAAMNTRSKTCDSKASYNSTLNTHTVCYGSGAERDIPIGIIWALTTARHAADDNDLDFKENKNQIPELKMARNQSRWPPAMIDLTIKFNSAASADTVAGITNSKRTTHQTIRKGFGNKEPKTWYQKMSLSDYQKLCDANMRGIVTPSRAQYAMELVETESAYYFFNAFNLENALTRAKAAGCHEDFHKEANWKDPIGGEVYRPRRGTSTYKLKGSQLIPGVFQNCYFPYVERLSVDDHYPGMVSLTNSYYRGTRDPDTQKIVLETQLDKDLLAEARGLARDAIRSSGTTNEDGFSIPQFITAKLREYDEEITKVFVIPREALIHTAIEENGEDLGIAPLGGRTKSIATLGGDDDDDDDDGKVESKVNTKYSRQKTRLRLPDIAGMSMKPMWAELHAESLARTKFAEKAQEQFWTRFNPDGDISEAEKAISKWLSDTLEKRGTFCMKMDPIFSNLTSFGYVIAHKFMVHESYFGLHVNHNIAVFLEAAVSTTPLEGSLKVNCFINGEASGGKSLFLSQLEDKMIPGIFQKSSGQSAAAELVAGASHRMNQTVVAFDETPPDYLGIGLGKATERGKGTASTQANTAVAAIARELISGGQAVYFRFSKDKDGVEQRMEIYVKAERCFLFCSNSDWNDLPRNAQMRMTPVFVQSGSRPDVSFVQTLGRKLPEKYIKPRAAYIERFRRDYAFIYLITKYQQFKALPPWTTDATDSMIIKILEYADKKGLRSSMDPRSIIRVKLLIKVCAAWDALYRFLDGKEAHMHAGEVWCWKKFLKIGGLLVTTPEHLVWAFSALAAEWVPPVVSAIVHAIQFNIDRGVDDGKNMDEAMYADDIDVDTQALYKEPPPDSKEEEEHTPATGYEVLSGEALERRILNRELEKNSTRLKKAPQLVTMDEYYGGAIAEKVASKRQAALVRGKKAKESKEVLAKTRGIRSELTMMDKKDFIRPNTSVYNATTKKWEVMDVVDQLVDTDKFYYARWDDATVQQPPTNPGRFRKLAYMIDPIISMTKKYPHEQIVGILVDWSDSKVECHDPYTGATHSPVFSFEASIRGDTKCTRVRLHKGFLETARVSLILESVKWCLRKYGFALNSGEQYITNTTDLKPASPVMLSRPKPIMDERTQKWYRHDFVVLKADATNPLMDRALDKMMADVVNSEKIRPDETNIGYVSLAMRQLSENAKWTAINTDRTRLTDYAVRIHLLGMRFHEPTADTTLVMNYKRKNALPYKGTMGTFPKCLEYKMGLDEEEANDVMQSEHGAKRYGASAFLDAIAALACSEEAVLDHRLRIVPEELEPEVFPQWDRGMVPVGEYVPEEQFAKWARMTPGKSVTQVFEPSTAEDAELAIEHEDEDDGSEKVVTSQKKLSATPISFSRTLSSSSSSSSSDDAKRATKQRSSLLSLGSGIQPTTKRRRGSATAADPWDKAGAPADKRRRDDETPTPPAFRNYDDVFNGLPSDTPSPVRSRSRAHNVASPSPNRSMVISNAPIVRRPRSPSPPPIDTSSFVPLSPPPRTPTHDDEEPDQDLDLFN
jgi:hypothetical protein